MSWGQEEEGKDVRRGTPEKPDLGTCSRERI